MPDGAFLERVGHPKSRRLEHLVPLDLHITALGMSPIRERHFWLGHPTPVIHFAFRELLPQLMDYLGVEPFMSVGNAHTKAIGLTISCNWAYPDCPLASVCDDLAVTLQSPTQTSAGSQDHLPLWISLKPPRGGWSGSDSIYCLENCLRLLCPGEALYINWEVPHFSHLELEQLMFALMTMQTSSSEPSN